MMVVIAIIAVLMAIVVPSFRVLQAQNRRGTCAARLKALGQALILFREDYKCYPPDATEFLWTEEALATYEKAYGEAPPGDHSVGTLVGAAYHPDGTPFDTGVHGLGLLTLYYLGAYSAQLPPLSSEPRLRDYTAEEAEEFGDASLENLRSKLQQRREGLNSELIPWFRGSGYITEMETYHCPANGAELREEDLVNRSRLPYLRRWDNYDMFYRRNYWHPGRPIPGVTDKRNLFQPYPPADTVVTWCPYHRSSRAPSAPGEATQINPGDEDLVLFADGSVRRMATQAMNQMYSEPTPGAGWPEGPIM